MSHKVNRSNKEWQQLLTPEQYRITRDKGTERAFTGAFWDCHDAGTYVCACCGTPLFASSDKYDSGSGWPSFKRPLVTENVVMQEDDSLGMRRLEVLCAVCDAHLGHMFDDGPAPAGKRYCINSASLCLNKESGSE